MMIVLKICGAAGIGIFTSAGAYLYSVFAGRAKTDLVRVIFFLLFMAIFMVGGLVAVSAIATTETSPNLRIAIMAAWIVVFWIYILLNWRSLKERLSKIPDQTVQ